MRIFLLLAFMFVASSARADVLVSASSNKIGPGQSVSFDVKLANLDNLNEYGFDLAFQICGTGTLSFSQLEAPTANHVFTNTDRFLWTLTNEPANVYRLNFSDAHEDAEGIVDIISGVNDRVVSFEVTASSDFQGKVNYSILDDSIFFDAPNYTPIDPGNLNGGSGTLAAVPEPSSLILSALGLGAVLRSRRTLCKKKRL